MAAKSHLSKKLEDVGLLYAKAYFASQPPLNIEGFDPEENIYTGRSAVDKSGPCVIIYAEKGKEEPLNSGNYWTRLHVIVKFPSGDESETAENYGKLVEVAHGAFSMDDLLTQLSSYTNQVDGFTAFLQRPTDTDSGAGEEDPDTWMDKRTKEIWCCASEIH